MLSPLLHPSQRPEQRCKRRSQIVWWAFNMSCNGCRVLRKGCSDTCILRSSLQWIDSPEAQGHATVFVAKFFGRAGMISFISAVSESQRPALFQSLLYEACGRTVNPVFGAVGLLWSGNWGVCQAAVETVLKGGSLRPSVGAAACFSTLSPKPTHPPPACGSNLPPAHCTTCSPLLSFNACLKRPPSEAPITPIKRLKVCMEPQQTLQEASDFISSPSKEDDSKQACQEFSHPQQNLAAKHEEATPTHNGQLHAPVPRRVRPHIVHAISSATVSEQACEEEATMRKENHDTIDLHLTLNSHGSLADVGLWKMGSPAFMRVPSPSSISVNSEGSVITSDTAEYSISCLSTFSAQGHRQAEECKLLHLL